MSGLSHVNAQGEAHMVDISAKSETAREAVAAGWAKLNDAAFEAVRTNSLAKGDVLAAARLAGIMAAKRTADLIPLCHPLLLQSVTVELTLDQPYVRIEAAVKTTGKTGAEMEALTAVSVAALTVYDMCKAVDKAIEIGGVRLIRKSGGKSGGYLAP